MNRKDAEELLKKYNKDPFHLRHGYTVGKVMEWFADNLGYAEEADFWGTVGLLHDVDFEMYPKEHCVKCIEILKEAGADEKLIRAVCCHGYTVCSDVKPEHLMEKVLFAADELTGLIWAAALMRPSKSTLDMELSSVKKKFKDKRFAAGCSRDIIRFGAEQLGWTLDELMEKTLLAMKESEEDLNETLAAID